MHTWHMSFMQERNLFVQLLGCSIGDEEMVSALQRSPNHSNLSLKRFVYMRRKSFNFFVL